MTLKKLMPYENDSAYLDHEFAWLRSHVAVMDLEKRLADAVSDDADPSGHIVGRIKRVSAIDHNRRLAELKEKEATLRAEIDERLEAHREAKTFTLGLDSLCVEAGLGAEERRIMIFLTLPAISPLLASDAYAGVGYYGHSLGAGEVAQLLKPVSTCDWLRFRKLFHVSSSLVRHGIIVEDWPTKYAHPGDILNATLSLTFPAFGTITGQPDLAAEGAVPNDCEPS